MVTSTDIVNQAIQLIGDNQPAVTGVAPNFDNSPAGKAAAALYSGVVATIARQFSWDFARRTVALSLSGNAAPFPWRYEYLYPTNGIQVWQILPQTPADYLVTQTGDFVVTQTGVYIVTDGSGADFDYNDPLPLNYSVANSVVGGSIKKVIQTNRANAQAVFNNNPSENSWDPGFRESVVRLLASELAMALAARPDTALAMLQSGSAFEKIAETRGG